MATLYLVATPIGNIEDITLRAIRVLGEVDLIAAEDTRVTRKLLSRYDIHTRSTSYHEHNRTAKLPVLLATLGGGENVALVSDAGTPTVSDPGSELVQAASEAGHNVVPIPGPSAITAAVAVSGLPTDEFVYVGFLPRRKAERRRFLNSLALEVRTLVVLEAPHRLRASLTDAVSVLGDRRVAACREMTKLHEEVFRGTLSAALDHFEHPRGEFTLVIQGQISSDQPEAPGDAGEMIKNARMLLERARSEGLSTTESVRGVARETGIPRSDIYRLWVEGTPGSE